MTVSCLCSRERGFSLIELAIALLAFSLILGGLISPLSKHLEMRKINATERTLERAREAILGHAVANANRLPCPDIDGDGVADPGNDSTSPCPNVEGYLPTVTLGVIGLDGWGRRIRYRANNAYTEMDGIPNPPNTKGTIIVRNRRAERLTLTNPHAAAAILFSCGKNGIPDDDNRGTSIAQGCDNASSIDGWYVQDVPTEGEFDDILIWMSKNVLLNRLIAAGGWP